MKKIFIVVCLGLIWSSGPFGAKGKGLGLLRIKGSILMVHGSAPFNSEGRVPDERAGQYASSTFFKDIRENLESRGWKIVTYSKPGVFEHHVDYNVYKTTDLKVLGDQIRKEWKNLPSGRPRLVLAWSEGTLHVSQLPLAELDGVVLIGGISTNIREVILWQAGDEREKMEADLQEILKYPRDEMLGIDRPVGRLIDELKLPDNWKAFSSFEKLPMLILHGGSDTEVPVTQAKQWKKKLSSHQIDVQIFQEKNHIPDSRIKNLQEFLKAISQAASMGSRS
ncbi:MAG: hypothetical protein KDD35_04285 [Bdellovibrionales bacterium]|nr:hypothetical protein [Bdellovibrionales bacterium]